MLSFNSKNYIVEYKRATVEQWNGSAPKSNRYESVMGRFREPDETNAIGSAMDLICNVLTSSFGYEKGEPDLRNKQVKFYDAAGNLAGVFYDFKATPETEISMQNTIDYSDSAAKDQFSDYIELSKDISIKRDDGKTIVLVNKEWTFEIPSIVAYAVDRKFDIGLKGGIDLSGGSNSMVLDDFCGFYFALEPHNNFFGQFNTVVDCRYDNRITEGGPHRQIKYQDTDELYVDLFGENVWPMGLSIHLRVRGENITPYNFTSQIKPMDEEEQTHIKERLATIAKSIKLVKKGSKASTSKKKPAINNPDFIVSGTVLQKYIGSSKDIVVPDGVTELADSIFSGKTDLHSIVIPEGVKRIGYRAFENCFVFEKAVLPHSLKEIGSYAFVDCHKLKEVYLSDNITDIGDSAFSECFELKNVVLPKKLTYIDAFTFKTCNAFTEIEIPYGVQSLGCLAFANCKNLKSLYIPETVTNFDMTFMDQHPFDGSNNLVIKCPQGSEAEKFAKQHGIRYEIVNGVKANSAKSEKENNQEVCDREVGNQENAPGTVKAMINEITEVIEKFSEVLGTNGTFVSKIKAIYASIGGFFYRANDLEFDSDAIHTVSEIIGEKHDITKIHMQGAPTGWSYYNQFVWDLLTEKSSKYVVKQLVKCDRLAELNHDNGIAHVYYNGIKEMLCVLCLENGIDYSENRFCESCLAMVNKTIEESLVTVDEEFLVQGASTNNAAKWVVVNDEDCDRFSSDSFDEYYGTDEYIKLPEGIAEVSYCAFEKNNLIKGVIIPEGVTKIDNSAFAFCSRLEFVHLPDSLKIIGWDAFKGCKSLTRIDIPANVEEIKREAFKDCCELADVYISGSDSIKIDDFAFTSCDKLTIHTPKDGKAWKYAKKNKIKRDDDLPTEVDIESIPRGEKVTVAGSTAESGPENIIVNLESDLTEEEEAEKLRKEQEEARRRAEEEEKKRLEEEARRKAEEEERKRLEEARRKAEEERIAAEKKRREEEARFDLEQRNRMMIEAKKNALMQERKRQEQIVEENKGLFNGRRRKEALEKIAKIDAAYIKLQNE